MPFNNRTNAFADIIHDEQQTLLVHLTLREDLVSSAGSVMACMGTLCMLLWHYTYVHDC